MKYLIAIVLITQAALFARSAVAQVVPFSASAYNFENSPNNFNNSPNNFGATNEVYDGKGNRVGYEVQSPTGVTNFFDNNGNRIGYRPNRQ